MPKFLNIRLFILLFVGFGLIGCSSNQGIKDAWKSTRISWYTHASPRASIDYDDKGDMSQDQVYLSSKMVGIDTELIKLERMMLNGDKAPTGEWISKLFETTPWISGFAGVKADGQILGQEPAGSMDNYDFSPLLEIDEKQPMRALRAIAVKNDSQLPEILLATPLYESSDFLGVVVTSFNMSSLLRYSDNPDGMVILTPTTILWDGGFDADANSLLGIEWESIVKKDVTGDMTINGKTIYWVVRFLGNLPIIFAVPHVDLAPIEQDNTEATNNAENTANNAEPSTDTE